MNPSPRSHRFAPLLLGWLLLLAGCSPSPSPAPLVADAGPDRTTAVGTETTLDGTGSSAAAGSDYSWSVIEAPAGGKAVLATPNAPTTSFVADTAGTYTVRLRLQHGGREADDRVDVVVDAARSSAELAPGEVVTGVGGLELSAPPGAIETPLTVALEGAARPDTALPVGVAFAGGSYRLSSAADVYADRVPFIVALPLPDGIDPERLALALLLQPEDRLADTTGEGEDRSRPGPAWEFIEGVVDPDGGVFVAPLPFLAAQGRTVALVAGERFTAPTLGGDPALTAPRQQLGVEFEVACTAFADSGVACTQAMEETLEAELERAYTELTDLGFASPYLQQRIDVVLSRYRAGTRKIEYRVVYLAQLRPYRTVDPGDDRWPCGNDGSLVNRGGYSSASRSFFVCIGANGVDTTALETARHEYFHATQYGYRAVRDGNREKWVMEGTATASENSRATMRRDASRPVRVVDEPLTAAGNPSLIEYEAQDFWVHYGLRGNLGLDYLTDVFGEGANATAVDTALRGRDASHALADAFASWVKDQTFEKGADIGNGVLGTICTFSGAASERELAYGAPEGPPPAPLTFTLAPLSATVVRFSLPRFDAADYEVDLGLDSSTTDLLVKFYDGDDAGTPDCRATPTSREDGRRWVTMDAGRAARTLYALVANTSLTQSHSATATLTGRPRLTIATPTSGSRYREGEAVALSAVATGFADPDAVAIDWSYVHDGTHHLGESTSGDLLEVPFPTCYDGVVTATARGGGESAVATTFVACTPKRDRHFYNATRARSGYVHDDGRTVAADTTDRLQVGDDTGDHGIRTLLHFPLNLPRDLARIVSADLTVNLDGIEGDPYRDLLELRVYRADYGDSLDAGDYLPRYLPGTATFPFDGTTTGGTLTVDVSDIVRSAWSEESGHLQFVLQFRRASDDDGVPDRVLLHAQDRPGTLLLPALEVDFENF